MAVNPDVTVLQAHDIPKTAETNPAATGTLAATVQVTYEQNRFTRFEMLCFAITQGFTASGRQFASDREFGSSAVTLARAIAFEMDQYRATS